MLNDPYKMDERAHVWSQAADANLAAAIKQEGRNGWRAVYATFGGDASGYTLMQIQYRHYKERKKKRSPHHSLSVSASRARCQWNETADGKLADAIKKEGDNGWDEVYASFGGEGSGFTLRQIQNRH